jgi:hypothetical protein
MVANLRLVGNKIPIHHISRGGMAFVAVIVIENFEGNYTKVFKVRYSSDEKK